MATRICVVRIPVSEALKWRIHRSTLAKVLMQYAVENCADDFDFERALVRIAVRGGCFIVTMSRPGDDQDRS